MNDMNNDSPERIILYTPQELEAVEDHITEKFGDFPKVFRDNSPKDIKIDIAVIPPDEDRYFVTLVTMGLGAYRMNVPKELKKEKLERAELVMCLPASWSFDTDDPATMWPAELLNRVAHLPLRHRSWIGWGHSIDYSRPLCEDTELSAVLLLGAAFGEDSSVCHLPDGDDVNFYQMIPLYDIEMRYKVDHGTEALLARFGSELDQVVDLERKPVVTAATFELIDRVEDHSRKIEEKQLDINEINGANHIAMFLRWCIEHDLINEEFNDFFAEELDAIKRGELDIRRFIMHSLSGELTKEILSDEGKAFASFYYDYYADENSPCYPVDVDTVALEYFGRERFDSPEFADEAYLFIPYGDDYYSRISLYISKNYRIFLGR